ncbi:GNAT family N-acetyltransferase [Pelagibius sp. Alg239-R121]|uniref:GNAT family N-acetyltransferase n=1 Tax=Pelagibius sp. Alg239-R121 TaxID=2993448 RepID=UPI0024A65A03|nr:GNAT family N-acetyltransferase [Pelagibius sp. Alg239-R121]
MEQTLKSDTPRICLHPLTYEDARNFALLLGGDRKSISMMVRMPHPCTPQSAKNWIADHSAPGSCTFGIVRKSDKDFLGVIGLNTDESVPELGYWVGRPYWSHGYATEAVKAIESVAEALGIDRLAAETFVSNHASQRVLSKAGYDHKGVFDRNFPTLRGQDAVYRYEKRLHNC